MSMVTFDELKKGQVSLANSIKSLIEENGNLRSNFDTLHNIVNGLNDYVKELEARIQALEGVPVVDNRKESEYLGVHEFARRYKGQKINTHDITKSLLWAKYISRINRTANDIHSYRYELTEKGEKSNLIKLIPGGSSVKVNVDMAEDMFSLIDKYNKAVTEMMLKGVIDE